MAQLKARLAWRWMRTLNGEPGQGLAEYALILAFIAMACVLALGALGQGIANSPGFSLF